MPRPQAPIRTPVSTGLVRSPCSYRFLGFRVFFFPHPLYKGVYPLWGEGHERQQAFWSKGYVKGVCTSTPAQFCESQAAGRIQHRKMGEGAGQGGKEGCVSLRFKCPVEFLIFRIQHGVAVLWVLELNFGGRGCGWDGVKVLGPAFAPRLSSNSVHCLHSRIHFSFSLRSFLDEPFELQSLANTC